MKTTTQRNKLNSSKKLGAIMDAVGTQTGEVISFLEERKIEGIIVAGTKISIPELYEYDKRIYRDEE